MISTKPGLRIVSSELTHVTQKQMDFCRRPCSELSSLLLRLTENNNILPSALCRCAHPELWAVVTTVASSIVHSELDCCNFYRPLHPADSQTHRLRQIQNSLARVVVKAPQFTRTTSMLGPRHCSLNLIERVKK